MRVKFGDGNLRNPFVHHLFLRYDGTLCRLQVDGFPRALVHHYVIHQFSSLTNDLIESLAQQINKFVLQKLIEELAGHLYDQRFVFIF